MLASLSTHVVILLPAELYRFLAAQHAVPVHAFGRDISLMSLGMPVVLGSFNDAELP